MKEVTTLYFAQLSAQAGKAEEKRQTNTVTVEALFAELKEAYGWDLPVERVRFARNDEFCAGADSFYDGDVLAMMPPMSGG